MSNDLLDFQPKSHYIRMLLCKQSEPRVCVCGGGGGGGGGGRGRGEKLD